MKVSKWAHTKTCKTSKVRHIQNWKFIPFQFSNFPVFSIQDTFNQKSLIQSSTRKSSFAYFERHFLWQLAIKWRNNVINVAGCSVFCSIWKLSQVNFKILSFLMISILPNDLFLCNYSIVDLCHSFSDQ